LIASDLPRADAMQRPAWDESYPDPRVLRAEVEAMVDAVTGALVETLGEDLNGLWLKGSAAKQWDSPLDYVPEISDVDFHVRIGGPGAARAGTIDVALDMHADVERRFLAAVPSPTHTPRPQFLSIDQVETIPGYVPTPLSAVRTLHGPVPEGPGPLDPAEVVRTESTRLVESGDPGVVWNASLGLLENPGHHLFRALRALSWYISPSGGRVLCARGCDFEWVWSANRTAIVGRLVEIGEDELADEIVRYYTAAWRFFLSGREDSTAGRQAFGSALRVLQLGAAVGSRALGG
jgi:hypothetical protein